MDIRGAELGLDLLGTVRLARHNAEAQRLEQEADALARELDERAAETAPKRLP